MKVLLLDSGGMPKQWITWKRAAFYFTKDLVLWSTGEIIKQVRCGKSRITGASHVLDIPAVISVKGKVRRRAARVNYPSKHWIFRRDNHQCAYCGNFFTEGVLTKDHIHAKSKAGPDNWLNLVTSCKPCNSAKEDKSLEDVGYTLRYRPYNPTHNEILFFDHPHVTPSQWEILLSHKHELSRMEDLYDRIETFKALGSPLHLPTHVDESEQDDGH